MEGHIDNIEIKRKGEDVIDHLKFRVKVLQDENVYNRIVIGFT